MGVLASRPEGRNYQPGRRSSLPPLAVPGVLVGADVVAHPFVVEADAPVLRPGAVAAHLRMRRGAAFVGDPLAEARVEQQEGVGLAPVLLPGRLHALAGLGSE